jgi:hypothetical protein
MVRIKFFAHPRTPVVSPRFAPMASDYEHRESSVEQPEISLTDEKVIVSADATSEQGAGFDGVNPSHSFSNSENTSDSGGHVKIGATTALVGVSYDFGQSTVMRTHVAALKSFTRYFLKGFTRPPGAMSIPDPHKNEAVVFKDFFTAGLRIPPHPILLDILRKFQL